MVLALFKSHAALGKNSLWGSKIFNLKELMTLVLSERISLTHFKQVVNDFRQLEPCTDLSTQSGSDEASRVRIDHPSPCPGLGLSVVESPTPKEAMIEREDEAIQSEQDPQLVLSPLTHGGFGLPGSQPPIAVKSRKICCKDPLWEAVNRYEPNSPELRLPNQFWTVLGIIPRETSDPARSLHSAFDLVGDHKGD